MSTILENGHPMKSRRNGGVNRHAKRNQESPVLGGGAALAKLAWRDCHWPKGTPGKPGFGFCGASAKPGRPYCHKHCERAYQRMATAGERSVKTGPWPTKDAA